MTYLRSTDVAATVSKTRFNLLGKLPAGAAALMLGVSGLAMISGSAHAACAPATGVADAALCFFDTAVDFDTLAGDDDILILDGTHQNISGGADNDILTTGNLGLFPTVALTLFGGSGNDTIELNTAFLGVTVANAAGESGNDTITLSGATVTANINGGDDDDDINLVSGSVGAAVLGGSGNDNISLSGATVGAGIFGGTGEDFISLTSGSVTGNVNGGADNDIIELDGANVTGDIDGGDGDDILHVHAGSVANVLGSAGNDIIFMDGGTVTSNIGGGANNDTINLVGGSANVVFGGDNDDTITLNGASVTTSIQGNLGDDTILLLSGTANQVQGNEGDDTISLLGASLSFNILGLQDNDTINLVSGSATAADGGDGEDMITLSGASISGQISGGADNDVINLTSGSADSVTGSTGEDNITLNGASITNGIDGNADNDTITLLAGTAGGTVSGFTGDDTITLSGAMVGGISGGDGEDLIDLASGTTGNVSGGNDNDMITLNGATATSQIEADDGDDVINLVSGTAVSVLGNAGNDVITLDGASISSNLSGNDGEDTIDLLSGTVSFNVLAGNDNDTVTLNGASIGSSIFGGDGNDTIDLLSGSSANSILGDAGEDTITLNGATVAVAISGGADNDIINLFSGTVTNVIGDTGDDDITLDGATVFTNILGGDDDDTINLITGSFGNDLLAGDGSDTATIEATYSLASIVGDLDGGDDVSAADGFVDELTVLSSGNLIADDVLNWEIININNTNITLLGATLVTGQDFAGNAGLNVLNSTVDLDDGLAITGDVSINGTSILRADTPGGTGVYSVSDDLGLAGSATIDMSDGFGAGDTLSVGNDFFSPGGGSLLLDVALNATEAGDSLVIGDNVFQPAATEITFTDTDPFGPPSFTGTGPGNGIVVVDNSAGGHISDGDFVMDPVAHPTNEILKVPFVYTLNLESDDILYLQSDVLAQIYGYAILAELMREDFPILRERLGDKRYNGFSGDGTDNDGAAGGGVGWDNGGIWARIEGTKRTNEHRGDFTTGEWEASRIEAEVGIDIPMNVGGGQGLFGISTHFIQGFADANSGLTPDPDVAEVDTTGFGAGLSFVYFPGGGFYADVQGRFTAWDADVEVDNRSIDQDINALGWGASLEVGNRIAFGNTAVTPRGRAIYSDVSFESFTDDDGVKVKQEDSASVVVEGGVTVEQMFPDNGVTIFADASVSHDVLRDSAIDASGFTFDSGLVDTWGTVAIGGSMETGQGTSAFIAAEVSSPFGTTFGNSIGYGLRAGVRVDF